MPFPLVSRNPSRIRCGIPRGPARARPWTAPAWEPAPLNSHHFEPATAARLALSPNKFRGWVNAEAALEEKIHRVTSDVLFVADTNCAGLEQAHNRR